MLALRYYKSDPIVPIAPMYSYNEFETETVAVCPICASSAYQIAWDDVPDVLCKEAGNLWRIARCNDCSSLYLKTRPRAEFISRAYLSYYTHHSAGLKHRLKRSLMMAYTWLLANPKDSMRVRYILVALITFPFRSWLDSKSRHLRIFEKTMGSGLDVGCGNGDFLEIMNWLGIMGHGIDFDGEAVRVATNRGFSASVGSLDDFRRQSNDQFDLVAAGHVLEHVYSPAQFFSDCYQLLKPGGFLWIQVPNAMAAGLENYGKFWRGLEAPRHISIPSEKGLLELGRAQGFMHVLSPSDVAASLFTARKSEAARLARNASGRGAWLISTGRCLMNTLRLLYVGATCRERQEFLTIVFKRPLES